MKFLKWAAVIVLTVLPVAEVVGHLVVQQTDAYQTLGNFVQNSAGIRERVGDRPKMSLHFFGYSVRVSGPSGSADFSASVEGSKGTGELYASLVKKGDWKIVSVKLDGQEIQAATVKESPAAVAKK
ncbi:cytochrome c oxidase assembly factor Coa1 family protein [Variovorax sp. Root434]|uniref:cytochrome c oxidase assembly factor Coa1 family protein n=1 Tax=Variovorax sp. Root434 TaxID=1736536 RepID=UPI0009E7F6FE|nr:cytochrome c oxidase assembly factor Coa1 family protein [Variovorax sp. Root434]